MNTNGRLLLEATVIGVGEGPYYYPACKQCYSKLTEADENTETFTCLKCGRSYQEGEVNQRYRLCLTVSDGLTLASVTAFGNMLTPYLGCSARDLHAKWKRQIKETYNQTDSSPLKCALEHSMVGSRLLFGFKGAVKNPKGVQIRLKDVATLAQNSTSFQYPGRRRDLIAVQIVPQCDSQYPVPVIHYLQKLDSFTQSHEQGFNWMSADYHSIFNVTSNNCLKNNPPPDREDSDLPMEDIINNSNICGQSGLSISLSQVGGESEISVDFSMTQSTQNSYIASGHSISNSSGVSVNNMLSSKQSSNGLKLYQSENIETPLSSIKSTWCVKKWRRKHEDSRSSQLRPSNRLSNICNSSGMCSISSQDSTNFFASPEQSRDKKNTNKSSNSFSNFSIDDIILSPGQNESSLSSSSSKSCNTTSDTLPNRGRTSAFNISRCVNVTQRPRKPLTLRSNQSRIEDFDSDGIAHLSTFKHIRVENSVPGNRQNVIFQGKDCENEWDTDTNTNISTKGSKGFRDSHELGTDVMPESEEFDLFLAAANLEEEIELERFKKSPSVSKIPSTERNVMNTISNGQTDCDKIPMLSSHCDDTSDTENTNKSILKEDNLTRKPLHGSFMDMSESDDFVLLEAADNFEQFQIDRNRNISSDKSLKERDNLALGMSTKSFKNATSPINATSCGKVPVDINNASKDRNINMSKMHDRSFENSQASFIDIPESEEFDLFLAEANFEYEFPFLKPVSSKNSDKKTNMKTVDSKVGGNLNLKVKVGDSNALSNDKSPTNLNQKIDENLNDFKDNEVENYNLDLNSNNGLRNVANCLRRLELDGNIGNSDSQSQSLAIHDNEGNNSSNEDFNDSCDLFNSPVKSCNPLDDKVGCKEINLNDDRDNALLLHQTRLNDSCSLFSSSSPDSSSSPELFVRPHKIIFKDLKDGRTSTPFATVASQHQSYLYASCVDHSVDLFSPELKTPHKLQKHHYYNSKTCGNSESQSSNLCDYNISPDLFSTQEF